MQEIQEFWRSGVLPFKWSQHIPRVLPKLEAAAESQLNCLKHLPPSKQIRTTSTLGESDIPFQQTPKYLGVALDHTLSFKARLTSVAGKVHARSSILRRLAYNSWEADFHVFRTSALAICYFAAEYCAPVWESSPHTSKVDKALNEAMSAISRSLRSTPIAVLTLVYCRG